MHIIPVIDLLNGVVVHAKQGMRQQYLPIQSQLTQSHQTLDIVAALLDVYPFTQLYIADLNAIQKLNSTYTTNYQVIEAIQQHFPSLNIWLDAGISNNIELGVWQKLNVRLVIGSENFATIANYSSLNLSNIDFILSLDFMPHGFAGPKALLTNTRYWPKDIVIMTLANVGANQGPNINFLDETLKRANGFNIMAAGGVRHMQDLLDLQKIGINAALVATALHQKQVLPKDILSLMNEV